MPITIHIVPQTVPLIANTEGTIYAAGTRVTLDTLLAYFQQGLSAEVIASKFPTVSLGNVYAIIAYYLGNRALLDNYLAHRDHDANALQEKLEESAPSLGIRARLIEREQQHKR